MSSGHRRAGPAPGRGLIVTPGSVRAGRRGPGSPTWRARVAGSGPARIGQLRAHYCQALDDGRWDDLVDLFTPDGAFVGLSTARGHDELRTFFADLQDGPLSAWWHFCPTRPSTSTPRRGAPPAPRPARPGSTSPASSRGAPHRSRPVRRPDGSRRRRPMAVLRAPRLLLLLGALRPGLGPRTLRLATRPCRGGRSHPRARHSPGRLTPPPPPAARRRAAALHPAPTPPGSSGSRARPPPRRHPCPRTS